MNSPAPSLRSSASRSGRRPAWCSESEWEVRCELAACYHLAAKFGWTDLLSTHISARIPGPAEEFLINPYALMFDEITATSLVKVNQQGDVLSETPHAINRAGFVIHSCIHAARHDVGCVMHTHTRAGAGVATQAGGLLPATQHALVIWEHIAYHDFEGPALDLDEQRRLVADIADKRILILRNHGLLTAGRSIAEAFVLMYRIERACRVQLAAQSGGQALYPVSREVIEKSIQAGREIFGASGFAPEGRKEWEALIRRLDRDGVDFRC